MALAPVTYCLWQEALRYDPQCPWWPARDRFVLSCGHASMLLYSLLHVAGVRRSSQYGQAEDSLAITLEDIQNFRQLNSPCAGHPEFGDAAGIETTTGPLGQGIATSVGMAMAAKWLASRYDRPEFRLFDFDTYALCSDGDIMEGVGCEAASLAGHLKLANLCWIYDDNHITIEGHTDLAFSENVAQRFAGLGWHTVVVEDANDLQAIQAALRQFKSHNDGPTLIILRSIIGYGSPNKADTHGAHGAPLGEDEIRLTKAAYGWPEDEKFLVPAEVIEHFRSGLGQRGLEEREAWEQSWEQYAEAYPQEASELRLIWNRELPESWESSLPEFETDAKGLATRVSSGKVLNALAPAIPWLVGGSADLAPSTMTNLNDDSCGHFGPDAYGGRNLHFGIREHAMAAICNGMSLSGLRAFGATFFGFTDYMRPSMRLASIMHQPVLYILTHDSIGLGEDGPTHQPVEHLAACRAIPRLLVFRPADANEVSEAYRTALRETQRPSALVLTRQGLPTLDRAGCGAAAGVARGGYILSESSQPMPRIILLSTGSEVEICLAAQQILEEQGHPTRVVSMPCFELFDEQDSDYRSEVLPPQVTARVGVEAGIRQGWDRYLGTQGAFVGMSDFGASAPYQQLYQHFGLTPENVAETAKRLV